MAITPANIEERLKRLDASNFFIGESLIFCVSCTWQASEPDITMQNFCPCCAEPTHTVKIDDDFLNIEIGE